MGILKMASTAYFLYLYLIWFPENGWRKKKKKSHGKLITMDSSFHFFYFFYFKISWIIINKGKKNYLSFLMLFFLFIFLLTFILLLVFSKTKHVLI